MTDVPGPFGEAEKTDSGLNFDQSDPPVEPSLLDEDLPPSGIEDEYPPLLGVEDEDEDEITLPLADLFSDRYAGGQAGLPRAGDVRAGPPRPDNPALAAPGPGDPRSDGYDRLAAARDDLRVLVTTLDEVVGQVASLTDTLKRQLSETAAAEPDIEEQFALAEQIAPEVIHLTATARELYARGIDQEPDLAFSAAAQMTSLKNDVKYAQKRFSPSDAWKKIWTTLKRAVPKLWSLISHLVKVKEWSVTGQIGAGAFGLAQASISVTFGK